MVYVDSVSITKTETTHLPLSPVFIDVIRFDAVHLNVKKLNWFDATWAHLWPLCNIYILMFHPHIIHCHFKFVVAKFHYFKLLYSSVSSVVNWLVCQQNISSYISCSFSNVCWWYSKMKGIGILNNNWICKLVFCKWKPHESVMSLHSTFVWKGNEFVYFLCVKFQNN